MHYTFNLNCAIMNDTFIAIIAIWWIRWHDIPALCTGMKASMHLRKYYSKYTFLKRNHDSQCYNSINICNRTNTKHLSSTTRLKTMGLSRNCNGVYWFKQRKERSANDTKDFRDSSDKTIFHTQVKYILTAHHFCECRYFLPSFFRQII